MTISVSRFDSLAAGYPVRLASVAIDLKIVGTTNLYTVPAGKTLVVTGLYLRCTAASAITVGATLGAGVAAGEDDLIAPQVLTNFLAANDEFSLPTQGKGRTVPAASIVKAGVDVAATGTSQSATADLMGYLI